MHEIKDDILNTPINHIIHCVNCQGVFGSGLAEHIAYKFPHVRSEYLDFVEWHGGGHDLLGETFESNISDNRTIHHVFGQLNYGRGPQRYVNYIAIIQGISQIIRTNYDSKVFAIPKIGCGLAGGDWDIMKVILKDLEDYYNVEFGVYEK